MKESFIIKTVFKLRAEKIFNSWLSSSDHSEMTGGEAKIGTQLGSEFSAWDGYITGTTIEISPFTRIVQNWRTSEFDAKDEDSLLEITFKEQGSDCILSLVHTNIPEGQGESYKQGWEDHYFSPMRAFFEDH